MGKSEKSTQDSSDITITLQPLASSEARQTGHVAVAIAVAVRQA